MQEYHTKVVSGRKVAGAIWSLVNARCLQHEYVRVLHEALLLPFLVYGSETMIWEERYRWKTSGLLGTVLGEWTEF